MKKSMSVLLAAAMCSAMLAGCGSTAADTAADASAETTAAAATEAADSSASAEGVNAVSYTHLTLPTTSRRQRQMCIRDRYLSPDRRGSNLRQRCKERRTDRR